MNILIRADASAETGGGHIGRCLALAEAARARGDTAVFATRADAELGQSMLTAANFRYHLLDCDDDWQSDASATAQILDDIDWIIVDHYGLDVRWEAVFRDEGVRILVLDDLADRRHACDVLVDTGRSVRDQGVYDGLVPTECRRLLGPRFLCLRREFNATNVNRCVKAGTDLLVFFGSADGFALTGPTLDALERLALPEDVTIHVVLTAATARYDELRARGGIVVHQNVTDMAGLLAKMDFVIGAGGISLWERCCMGVPSLTIALNDNQAPGVELAAKSGGTFYLSLDDARNPDLLAAAVARRITDHKDWPDIAAAGRRLVDGKGAVRVLSMLGPVRFRPATAEDSELIWRWAHDPAVRAMAFRPDPIPRKDHDVWYARLLANDEAMILIVKIGAADAGQVRFEWNASEGGWVIDISVSTHFRGKGMALECLMKAVTLLRLKHPGAVAIAWVKEENMPSLKLFEAAGFARDFVRSGAVRFCDRDI